MRTTFSISFYCRESKQNKQGLSPLELCININQQRLFINLPAKFTSKEFNKKRKPKHIEDMLVNYRVKVNDIVNELMEQDIPITAVNVREYIKTGGTKTYTVEMMVDEYLSEVRTSYNAFKKYEYVADFIKSEIGNKQLTTITVADINRLYDILKSKYNVSTAGSKMTKIKSMFVWSFDRGLIKNNIVSQIKINRGTATVSYLTNDDIKKIKQLDLSDYERLDKIRDLMLFQSASGLAYCDLVAFDITKVETINGTVVYCNSRQKTDIDFTSVILPIGIEIMNKYNGKLPLISNQKYNAYLKEIQQLAGIKTVITTHLLRKTYATFLLNQGIRIETVAKCIGHSTPSTTYKAYARLIKSTVINEVAEKINGGL